MSETSQNNSENQEIDLSQISKKIGSIFEGISATIFQCILFFKRNLLWIGILFVVGAGLGVFLDKNTNAYRNEIIVSPNFGSTDYLYAKVELINSKIRNNDSVFLKNVVGIKNTQKLTAIEIEPIVDVYRFIDNKPQNFELIKLMAEDGDLKKIVKEPLTSKNYPFHLISFGTDGQTSSEKTVAPILKYLNENDYYEAVQKTSLDNTKKKMAVNDSIIAQIDGVLDVFAHSANSATKSDKLIYYNENSQIDQMIKTKDALTTEQGGHRLEFINFDKIVKDISITLNIKDNKSLNGKMKLVIPFLLIFLFVAASLFKTYYKNQMAKLNK